MKKEKNRDYSSFRDPSGYVYYKNNKVFRIVNKSYYSDFEHFINSGLYDELLKKNLIIKHNIVEKNNNCLILEVQKIPFISYPYEWCFEQLRDAALLTLEINLISLKYGMILKDSSVYNVQFFNGRPIFIDTTSFIKYEENTPWGAYGQFTRHFISPLLLMNFVDERLVSLLKNYIDGIPLDLTESILKKRGGFFARQHICWQSRAIKKHNCDGNRNHVNKLKISKKSLINILNMLKNQILKLKSINYISEWDTYYENTNYSVCSKDDKELLVLNFVEKLHLDKNISALDLGANDGRYSRLISKKFNIVISSDYDYNVVTRNYLISKTNKSNVLPLVLDFNNPSPSIGFACRERKDIISRLNVELVLALAILHHIAISNNVPFDKIAEWFSSLGKYLIIEFVSKKDSQVKLLLKTRKDIFTDYNEDSFEYSFRKYFSIIDKKKIKNSERILYLMERK